MPNIILNKKEIALLKSAVRRGDPHPDFQKFLETLDHSLKEWTGQINITKNTQELIQYYGCNSGKLNWTATLHSIFGRTMGQKFVDVTDTASGLIETTKTQQPVTEEDHRERRVV